MWLQFLGREDPLEEGMATHSVLLPKKSCGQRSLTSSQDAALARYSVPREVTCSVLKWETVLGSLDATPKVP